MSHGIVVDITVIYGNLILVDCYKYFLSSYKFICALPSVYLVNDKDIKSYLCFQILYLRFYPRLYNSIQLSYNLCEIMQPCCIPLRDQRENKHVSVLNQCTKKPQCLSHISLIIADEPPNNQNHKNLTNSHSLRNNAAQRIPLRNLRENTHVSILNLCTKKTPIPSNIFNASVSYNVTNSIILQQHL